LEKGLEEEEEEKKSLIYLKFSMKCFKDWDAPFVEILT
jgi:hypothetical protein